MIVWCHCYHGYAAWLFRTGQTASDVNNVSDLCRLDHRRTTSIVLCGDINHFRAEGFSIFLIIVYLSSNFEYLLIGITTTSYFHGISKTCNDIYVVWRTAFMGETPINNSPILGQGARLVIVWSPPLIHTNTPSGIPRWTTNSSFTISSKFNSFPSAIKRPKHPTTVTCQWHK